MSESNWAFIEHATDFLRRPRLGDEKHPSLWPSEAGVVKEEDGKRVVYGKCARAVFFRFLESKTSFYSNQDKETLSFVKYVKENTLPTDPYVIWLWKAGDLYEEYVINIAKESGVYIGGQIPIYFKDENVSGKIDLLVINPENGKLVNVEVKSVYGYGSNQVLGTTAQRKKGILGTPRDSNLMQIALYDMKKALGDDNYDKSRLVYGCRDTGRFAEYKIWTEINSQTNAIDIYYQGNAPALTKAAKAPYTIDDILNQYQLIEKCTQNLTIPDRGYELNYSEEKIDALHKEGKLNKAETERYEKYLAYKSGENKRKIKLLQKGDWQCDLCSKKNVCYKSTDPENKDYGIPREF